ncbi:MAG: alpha-L-arabinofuranosidase C-terminal domain-containing protein, partial [Turicibacter sp.]
SLFPENTFNQRKNGLRADLAQLLKEINPGFIRFPGGCIVEGMVLENAYNWKHTVGPVETRKLNWNRWEGGQTYPYNQSYGLGFMEYFILAKDLKAEPLPIVNCGMSCQFQGAQLAPDFEPYIQDALDLIEFANGDETTVWGSKRIEYGHLKPFNLKYLGVGNEQWIDRIKHGDMDCLKIYELFRNRIKAVYPEINLITTSGPFPYGKEFDDAYEVIRPKIEEYIQKGEVYTEIIDEHFYMSPEWFLENLERYDQYPRYEDGKSGKIFLGEYACHTNRNGFSSQGVNNMLAALSEAAFLTSAERNADIIEMTTYAPLFAKKDRTQWGPDLIWIDNTQAYGTPSYYVQKMYGLNMGDYTLNSKMMVHSSVIESTDLPIYSISSFDQASHEII